MKNKEERKFHEVFQKAGFFGGPFSLQKGAQVGL